MPSKATVNNALIQFGNTTDSAGKGRPFKSRFIQPGIAGYPGQFGNVLITKETLDKFVNSLVGKSVIINHKDEITEDDEVGKVEKVWFNAEDGWYWCSGYIDDVTAENLIKNKGWSVSCSYDVLLADDAGGTENNIHYDMEFLDGVFTHLALVNNPRYERANIVFNSKTNVINGGAGSGNPDQKRNERGQWVKDDALIQQKKDNLVPIEVEPENIPQFETKEDLGKWFKKIFEDLGSVTITDTGIRIDLYGSNANRESFKRRLQQQPNKAVAQAFEEVVSKAIKVDERQKDKDHIHDQEIYYNKLKLGEDYYNVDLFVDYLELNDSYRYAGHNTTKIDNKISTRDTQVINHIMLTKVDNNIITDVNNNFNPNIKEHTDMNIKNEEKGRWVTIKGTHVFIPEGKSVDEVVKDKYGGSEDKNDGGYKKDLERIETTIKKLNLEPREEEELLDELGSFEAKLDDAKTEPREREALIEELGDFEEDIKRHYEMKKDEGKGYSLSEKYKNHIQFEDDKESSGYPRKIYKDKDEAISICKDKREKNREVDDTNGKATPIRHSPVVVKNPLGDGFIVATHGLAQKHNLKEVWPVNRTDNSKEQEMLLIEELKKLITKVENDKGDNMEKIKNEKVDKRDIIRQIMAIAGKHEDNEDVREIAKLAEKLGYDESEAGSANNCGKAKNDVEDNNHGRKDTDDSPKNSKAKNENEDEKDEEKVKELKEDVKKDVENKCKNSKESPFDEMMKIYNASFAPSQEEVYTSREAREQAAEDYFRK